MRVALVASLVSPIRRAESNGPHSIIIDLARGLGARGHETVVFAARGSTARGVRVHEKSEHADGKDLRIWEVTRTDDGRFEARHDAAF